MQQLLSVFILVFYLISQFLTGHVVMAKLLPSVHGGFRCVGSVLLGTLISVPMTYILSLMYVSTGEAMFWAVVTYAISAIIIYKITSHGSHAMRSLTFSGVHIPTSVFFSIAGIFSWWLMSKTFHSGASGELFVGSNNVFDFGHAMGIVRSFSWGSNIPFSSPFESGLLFFYHFFFLYWVSIWEYFGVPVVWAMNIPSAVSFFCLLVVVYFLPQKIAGQSRLVGYIAVLLTVTHSTLTFWYLLLKSGITTRFFQSIWQLPTYPYAGPFDGSVISIFMTLNNYVNQRHLAIAIALGLFLTMMLIELLKEKKLHTTKILIIGALTGLMFFWNMAICVSSFALMILVLILKKHWQVAFYFSFAFGITVIACIVPYIPQWKDVVLLIGQVGASGKALGSASVGLPAGFSYLWQNLGLLPVVAIIGFIATTAKQRVFLLPFLILFILECLHSIVGLRGFDQKFLSFLIVGVNVVGAIGVVWVFQQRMWFMRIGALVVIFTLTVSGLVDLMAIKNEFAFPLVNSESAKLISWMKGNTPKKSVFVSYSDMIDPVVFAGRKNYFGFYGNVGLQDRSGDVARIYAGELSVAEDKGITYILIPKWEKSDFPYVVQANALAAHTSKVFETEKHLILEVNGGMLK